MDSITPPPTDAQADPRREGIDTAVGIILHCMRQPALVAEFNRLTGNTLGAPRAPIIRAIDEATGYEDAQLKQFAEFVMEFVLAPLLASSPPTSGEGK